MGIIYSWRCAIMEIVSLNLIMSGRNSYYKSQSITRVSPLLSNINTDRNE